MALDPDPNLKTAVQPIPLGPLFDPQSGKLTLTGTGYFDANRRQTGEVLSGVNHNRDLITQLETEYVGADATLSAAISAEAVVRANEDGALATLITALTVEVDGNTASVTTNATAIGDIEGNLAAAYGATVDVNGRVAALKLLSDGTTATASILGDLIYFGPQTVFDTASETFITEVGSIRSRYGTAFGASSDLIRWDGPTSVAQDDETPTNGYLAIKTDGTIYHNSAALGWGATAAEAAASNAQVGAGANSLVDTRFRDLSGFWTYADTDTPGTTALSVLSYASGIRIAQVVGTSFGSNGYLYLLSAAGTNSVSVKEGDNVGVSALIGGTSLSKLYLRIRWYDSSDTYLSLSQSEILTSGFGTGAGESSFFAEHGFVATAPANAAYGCFEAIGQANAASPRVRCAYPTMTKIPAGQTVPPPISLGMDASPGADVTENNTASAIVSQGVFATGNFYEQASAPSSAADGSFWAQTGSGDLYIRASSTWKKVANIGGDLSISLSPDSYIGASGAVISATASGGSGVYSSYAWTKVSGTSMSVSGGSTDTATFTSATTKDATYRCTVTDSLGATAYQDIVITIVVV